MPRTPLRSTSIMTGGAVTLTIIAKLAFWKYDHHHPVAVGQGAENHGVGGPPARVRDTPYKK